jgi:uncharacterized membrane protein YkvI
MNEPLKSLAKMMVATLVGLTVVTIVALTIRFRLSAIVDAIFPLPSPTPLPSDHGLAVTRLPDPNFGVYLTFLVFSELFNGCIGSLIAQFFFRRWGGWANSRAWQSFIIGFIIGLFSVILQELLKSRLVPIIAPLIYGVIAALIGLLSYYMAGRKYPDAFRNKSRHNHST